ncbi:MAG: YdcF family protein [bacterium]
MRKLVIGVLVLLGLFILTPFMLQWAGNRLIVADKLGKADVIIVLGGDGNGERVDMGVKLFKQGMAPKLLMSGGPLAWKLTFADWMKKQAVELGVKSSEILTENKSRSTIEDAEFCLPIVKQHGFRSVILVTSPTHSRRARNTFRKMFGKEGIKVLVQPAYPAEFDPNKWWTRHEDLQPVVWEYVSMVLYFVKGY